MVQMEVDMGTPADRRRQLREAIAELTSRGLSESARWCAEQLVGLPPEGDDEAAGGLSDPAAAATAGLAGGDDDAYLLGKAYFDCQEYRRAAARLQDSRGPRAKFLRCYSSYLAGAKQQQEERVEKAGPLGQADAVNPDLEALDLELRQGHKQGSLDGYCLYLYALVLVDRQRSSEAMAVLTEAVAACPCNWAAWKALESLCRDKGTSSDALDIPTRHWAAGFFRAGLCLEIQKDTEGLERLEMLYDHFPNSSYIIMQSAVAHYNLRNFDDAQQLFQDLLQADEFRVDCMDTYSNILYVKGCFAEMSHLAHRTALTDKYRPETCCIIGNYYSLKGQHEKAVMYFRRALKLNSHYLSAWTLMGHEFIEMKNPSAAIDAYRRAVDINPRDFRAWYGLGQAYELIMMPYYALYYFRRATQLRPHDARMWCAMGQCYENEQLGNSSAAIQCYIRAAGNDDREGIALHKLAELHDRQGDRQAAAHYYTLNLDRIDAENGQGSDALAALSFLAQYYKDKGELHKAEDFCNRLLDFGGPQRDKAAALLREIHSMQGSGGGRTGRGPHRTPPPAAGGGGAGGAMAFHMPGSPGSDIDLDYSPM